MAVMARSKPKRAAAATGAGTAAQPARLLADQAWKLLLFPFLLLILIPILTLFLRIPLSSLQETLRQPQVTQAVTLSLVTASLSTLISILAGSPVAYYLSHPRYRFHRLVDTLVDLPTILPPAVAGVALLMAFGRTSPIGQILSGYGLTLPFTTAAVIIAQVFISASLYIKAAAIGFSGVDCEMKRAAALDGASKLQVFRYITIPAALPALVSGAVMSWARAMGEFGATIIFAGNFPGRTQTMPLAIYLGFEMDLSVALALSALLVGISFFILILLKVFIHNSPAFSANNG